jgi:RimJ/RimL family protein N-acetyltransferase
MTALHLRPLEDDDLDVFYAHQADPKAAEMAAFASRDRAAFDAHWARIRRDPETVLRTIVGEGGVLGGLTSWRDGGRRLVGYWIGREHWGRGVATRALEQFLREVTERPLHAYVATHNAASARVLEKCGFRRDEAYDSDDLLFVLSSTS